MMVRTYYAHMYEDRTEHNVDYDIAVGCYLTDYGVRQKCIRYDDIEYLVKADYYVNMHNDHTIRISIKKLFDKYYNDKSVLMCSQTLYIMTMIDNKTEYHNKPIKFSRSDDYLQMQIGMIGGMLEGGAEPHDIFDFLLI